MATTYINLKRGIDKLVKFNSSGVVDHVYGVGGDTSLTQYTYSESIINGEPWVNKGPNVNQLWVDNTCINPHLDVSSWTTTEGGETITNYSGLTLGDVTIGTSNGEAKRTLRIKVDPTPGNAIVMNEGGLYVAPGQEPDEYTLNVGYSEDQTEETSTVAGKISVELKSGNVTKGETLNISYNSSNNVLEFSDDTETPQVLRMPLGGNYTLETTHNTATTISGVETQGKITLNLSNGTSSVGDTVTFDYDSTNHKIRIARTTDDSPSATNEIIVPIIPVDYRLTHVERVVITQEQIDNNYHGVVTQIIDVQAGDILFEFTIDNEEQSDPQYLWVRVSDLIPVESKDFGIVTIDDTAANNVEADDTHDTLNLRGGEHIALSSNPSGKTVTISHDEPGVTTATTGATITPGTTSIVTGITTDGSKHVTAFTTGVLPEYNNQTVSVGNITFDPNSVVNFAAGSNITLTTNENTITIASSDISLSVLSGNVFSATGTEITSGYQRNAQWLLDNGDHGTINLKHEDRVGNNGSMVEFKSSSVQSPYDIEMRITYIDGGVF